MSEQFVELVNLQKYDEKFEAAYQEAMSIVAAAMQRQASGAHYDSFYEELQRAYRLLEQARHRNFDAGSPPSSISHERVHQSVAENAAQVVIEKRLENALMSDPDAWRAFLQKAFAGVERVLVQRQEQGLVAVSKAERQEETELGQLYYTLRSCLKDGLSPAEQVRSVMHMVDALGESE